LRARGRGEQLLAGLLEKARQAKREPIPISELILAGECGGSDFTSGIASNPAVGAASDLLIAAGGTALYSETTELIGAEHLVASRAVNEEVGRRLLEVVARYEQSVMNMGFDMRWGNPSAGNLRGGL